ncbi:HutD family protein [Ruegeria sp. 6PALISEP08]|uniref:HutD/Ves family protein n=1 Tax=Ruegeria sp. 6PALISEP08 TaxID=1225660 RepID=UPI00067EA985|nr:HutD family protein [Ruegeria sp. 6PALISEP08]
MMRVDACKATRWANGGGVTRELAAKRVGGQVAWRISVAEIEREGPFSRFPGLARVHTIIEGAGLALHGADEVLSARPFEPLRFDGALAVTARLLDGPCRAFNVIYDPQIVSITVDVHSGKQAFYVAEDEFVFVVSGTVSTDRTWLVAGDAIRTAGAAMLAPAPDSKVLHVRFAEVPA